MLTPPGRACLVLLALTAPGCAAIGRFGLARGRDLLDCARVEVGACLGVGVSVRGAGIAQLGAAIAVMPDWGTVGWNYGRPAGFLGRPKGSGTRWGGEMTLSAVGLPVAAVWIPVAALAVWPSHGQLGLLTLVHDLRVETRMRPANIAVKGLLGFGFWEIEGAERMTVRWSQATRQGTFFLPGLIGKVGDGFPGPWAHLWSDEGLEEYRYAHVHAFDAEVRVYAGLAYAIVGVSPGEFVDFLAGFVGLDPARDDGR